MTAPKTKRRSHTGLHPFAVNVQRLITEFRARELTRRDIMELFDFSESGAGRYVIDLMNHDIIEIARFIEPGAKTLGRPVYWITASETQVAAYIAGLSTRPKVLTKAKPKQADKSRHFHVMHDDAAFKVKVHRAPAAPDPMALDRAFFRPQVADDAPRLAMPIIPPKPQGFPVPSEHRFELASQP